MGCFRFPQGESYLPRRAFEIALQGELRLSCERVMTDFLRLGRNSGAYVHILAHP
eukprot:COSAG06_NODE_33636_length_486_cov_20.000000_1_plen_55_part_00